MRLLLIHSDWIEYQVKQKTGKWAEPVSEEEKSLRLEEALVAFITAEKEDERDLDQISEKATSEIEGVAKQLKLNRLMLYPYAHLSSSLASPEKGKILFKKLESTLRTKGFEVKRSPFGWYKAFKLSCKGHPLSELSREVKVERKEEKAVETERKLVSHWYVVDLENKLHELKLEEGKLKGFDFSAYPNLEKFTLHELAKKREAKEEPIHVKFMRQLELVDYEPASDPGNFRFLPKGKLIKSLLEQLVINWMQEHGAIEVETPLMYDLAHPALANYLARFPARQYTVSTPNKDCFLRFSACFGQFLMAKEMSLSYKHLPLWVFELAKSFRLEQRGELTGLRRLRAFTMPDCHAFCADIQQAKQELLKRFKLSLNLQRKIGFSLPTELELGIRATRDFWEANKELIASLLKLWKKPALVELWDQQFFYFILKYELNFVDFLEKASALTTDQIDIENAKRYGISYETSQGKAKEPIILHLSPSGTIERVIYALLERAWIEHESEGKKPSLPFWLSPIQLRLIPVSQDYLANCKQIAQSFKGVARVDIDDREESVARKIRDAEHEWIPLNLVYGAKELQSGKLSVRIRNEEEALLALEELKAKIIQELEGYPFLPLPLPLLVSKRPKFIG
jgi:threonyl-tRNA synthetase